MLQTPCMLRHWYCTGSTWCGIVNVMRCTRYNVLVQKQYEYCEYVAGNAEYNAIAVPMQHRYNADAVLGYIPHRVSNDRFEAICWTTPLSDSSCSRDDRLGQEGRPQVPQNGCRSGARASAPAPLETPGQQRATDDAPWVRRQGLRRTLQLKRKLGALGRILAGRPNTSG